MHAETRQQARAAMYVSGGITAGYIYELKKRMVLTGIAGICGFFASGIFAGVSFPIQLNQQFLWLDSWINRIGNEGLARAESSSAKILEEGSLPNLFSSENSLLIHHLNGRILWIGYTYIQYYYYYSSF